MYISPLFRHASINFDPSSRSWTVPPALNWAERIQLAVPDMGACGQWAPLLGVGNEGGWLGGQGAQWVGGWVSIWGWAWGG